jgi:phage FluMu gp28-like protein
MTREGLPGSEQFAALADLPLLLPYQSKLDDLLSSTSLAVIEKSRRIGFTWGIAATAVLRAATRRSDGGTNVFYISYEKEMTREFIDTCAAWAKLFGSGAAEMGEFMFEDQRTSGGELHTEKILAFRIGFASGFNIVALSSAPRNLRGRQGLVIIDEAAFHPDLGELLKSALALTIWGDQVVVISTHNGVGNAFNLLIEDINAGRQEGAVLRVTFADAIAQGLCRRIFLKDGTPWSREAEIAWEARIRRIYQANGGEELDCVPSLGSGSWFNPVDLAAAMSPNAQSRARLHPGPSWIGNDIAVRHDQWVASVIQRSYGRLALREEIVRTRISFAEQDRLLDDLVLRWDPMMVGMDQTGLGEKPVEDAMRRYPGRAMGIHLIGERRQAIASAAKSAFEAGIIDIPPDNELRSQLLAIKRQVNAAGMPMIVTDTGSGKGHHADRAWALMIAIALADPGDMPVTEGFHIVAPDGSLHQPRASGGGLNPGGRRDLRW